ncbi:MAG TPA: hypothetical protein VL175_18305 [Pirellulales bacterium]|jgi:hypothetical protein|nr:hypothetical protein [Pirellulales bacterium]
MAAAPIDPIALASLHHLAARLRRAGEANFDLRCYFYHDLDIPFGFANEFFGPTFFNCSFRPLVSSKESWRYFFFNQSESDLRSPFRKPRERDDTDDDDRVYQLYVLIRSLLGDALWLVSDLGFSTIPGCPDFVQEELFGGESTWIWLLHHAAWERPGGTILRAAKYYPASLLARAEYRKRRHDAQKLAKGDTPLPAVTKETRRAEWLALDEQHEAQAAQRLAKGQYASVIPIDPFTASAALLDLIAAGGTARTAGATTPTPLALQCWSDPMSKSEMARRITGRNRARYRDVESIVAQHDLRHHGGNKWSVRIDSMAPDLRSKIEKRG